MVGLIITISIAVVIAVAWASGISNMKEKHPNYKGEDFLNWDWDEDKNHTEGEL